MFYFLYKDIFLILNFNFLLFYNYYNNFYLSLLPLPHSKNNVLILEFVIML